MPLSEISSIFGPIPFPPSVEGSEKSSRDLQFLQIGVSGEINHFHPVFEAEGMGSVKLPVVMNITRERSKGTLR